MDGGTPDASIPVDTTRVGPAGGTVVADYGRLSLTFPPGALSAETSVTVTPVAGHAPGALGNAYTIETGGAVLAAPVVMTFSYSSRDLLGTTAALARLAFQDTSGTWNLVTGTVHDATHQTLTVETTHFSTWAAVVGWRLEPTEAATKVGTSLPLTIKHCWPTPLPNTDLVPLLNECQPGTATRTTPPRVDGIPGGNSSVGTVTDNVTVLNFTAPAMLPALDPITVVVSVGIDDDGVEQLLSSPVVVYDSDVYAFLIELEMLESAVVSEGTSGDTRSKSWNERVTYAGIIRNGPLGWSSSGPVIIDVGINNAEQQNAGSVVIQYRETTSGGRGVFTNREATGGNTEVALEVHESAGMVTHLKLPKDGSGLDRCTMVITGNGMDAIYDTPCVFSGYPSTVSFMEDISLDGTAPFAGGQVRLPITLCPSDCSTTQGHTTLRWSFQRIVSQ
jgi:hypothetical protein